jgi:microcin C transport system substrate-binding protein
MSTCSKNLDDRRFDLTDLNWSGVLFPSPQFRFHSSQADKRGTSNVTGFKDPRVDALCSMYPEAFDMEERVNIIREIDGIVFNQHHYILTWYSPCDRVLYWNRFGYPDWYTPRTGGTVLEAWWIDVEKDNRVRAGKADPSITMPIGETEVRFWEAYNRSLQGATAAR